MEKTRLPISSSTVSARQWLILAAMVMMALHVTLGRSDYPRGSHFASLVFGLITIYCWWRYFRVSFMKRAPIAEVCVTYSYVLYAIAMFFRPAPVTIMQVVPRAEAFEFASFVALAYVCAFLVGFAISKRFFASARVDRLLPAIGMNELERAATPFLVLTGVVSLLVRYRMLGPLMAALETIFSPPINLAIQYYLMLSLPSRFARWRMVVAVLLQVAVFFFHSSLETLAYVFIVVLLVKLCVQQRVSWLMLAIAIGSFITLQPAKGYYREYAWTGDVGAGELQDQGSALDAWEYAFTRVGDEEKTRGDLQRDSTFGRLSELSSLAFTVDAVPAIVPFQGGLETIDAIVVGSIPRIVWPNKPNMLEYGQQKFSQIAGITTYEQDQYTATSFPIVHHAYMDLGLLGVAIWGILLGFFARLSTSMLSNMPYRVTIGMGFAISFAINIALVSIFAGVLQHVAAWLIFGWMVRMTVALRSYLASSSLRSTGT